jgi:hypothetical protein
MPDLNYIATASMVGTYINFFLAYFPNQVFAATADFLIQTGLATQIRFHGKRFAWFVSDGAVLSPTLTLVLTEYGNSHKKGLGVAAKYYGIRSTVSQSNRRREGVFEAARP